MDRSLIVLLLAILVVLGAIAHQQGKRIEALEAQQAVNLDSIEWVDQRVDGMGTRHDGFQENIRAVEHDIALLKEVARRTLGREANR